MSEVYKIIWNEGSSGWEMDGVVYDLVGDALIEISKITGVTFNSISESGCLYELLRAGVDVKVLEEDGSAAIW